MNLIELSQALPANSEPKRSISLPEILPAGSNISDFLKGSSTDGQFTIEGVVLRQMYADGSIRQIFIQGVSDSMGLSDLSVTFIFTDIAGQLVVNIQSDWGDHHLQIPGIDQFFFQQIKMTYTVPDGISPSIKGQVSGVLNLLPDLRMGLDLPIKKNRWHFSGAFIEPKGIVDLIDLIQGGDFVQSLPDFLRTVTDLQVKGVEIVYDGEGQVLSDVTLHISTPASFKWEVLPKLSLTRLNLQGTVMFKTSPKQFLYLVTGDFQIGDDPKGTLEITAAGPEFQLTGGLKPGGELRFKPLIQYFFGASDSFPEITVSSLSFFADPKSEQFSIKGVVVDDWKFYLSNANPGIYFALAQLSFSINKNGKDITGDLGAILDFSGVNLSLNAGYRGSNAGWDFSGATGPDQQIPLGRLIADDIAPKFGGLHPPAPIAGLVIENLSASFNTNSKDFTFSGETLLPLAAGSTEQVDLTLKIDLKNQKDGSYSKQFAGLLKLKGLEFDLLFDTQRQVSAVGEQAQTLDSQTFLAIFQNPAGKEIPVDDLIKPLGLNIETGLSFTIKEALLAYQKTSAASDPAAGIPTTANGKWLFGIDIEGGLNLSAIHIDDLPFVSIPPDQVLKLEFQVLAASQAFTQEEIQTLTGLAPSGGLGFPTKAIEKIDLSVTLDLGTTRKQIDLPIGLQTQTAPAGDPQVPANNGLVPVDQANNSTPQSDSGVTATGQDGVRWITLQKQLGPLAFERIGVKYADSKVEALLDASFSAGGLTIALNGLSVSSPIGKFEPTFGLNGLGIDFKNASVEIGGTFLKEPNGFAGLAVIRTEALSLSAIGAYAYADGEPSLFLYAVLDYPFGGPAFFFVTGVAAGFGYNRRLVMPGIEQVATFPLVLEATGGPSPSPLPTSQQGRAASLQSKIQALDQYIPIDNGQYFLAVGLKFTSFKQIDSFALLVVQFGNRFEIDLLGLSTLKVPSLPEGGTVITPVAEAQLALKAVFIPSEGFLGVRAQLTSNSYILSRSCRLTGGFAFYSWFAGQHEGDFVLTLGGYHPAFKVPDHYPKVPRLGFQWVVSPQFYLRGALYFALTANALMAGGRLDALFQTSNIKAWFTAGADFLIAWKPYHYEIAVYISMGLDITFDFFGTHHITLSASADLKLWGPEFGGEAHIKVKVLFFTIPVDIAFGSRAPAIPALNFTEFKQTYLPADPSQVCSVTIRSGLIETVTENDEEIWIVNAKEMVLVTNSSIPSGRSKIFGQDVIWDGGKVAVQPMGVSSEEITTMHEVSISGMAADDISVLKTAAVAKKMPAALWGKPELAADEPFRHVNGQRYVEKPQINGERFVEDTLAGYEIRVGKRPLPVGVTTHPLAKEVLKSEIKQAPEKAFWEGVELKDAVGTAAWQAAATTDRLVQNTARDELLAALGLSQLEVDFGEPITQNVAI